MSKYNPDTGEYENDDQRYRDEGETYDVRPANSGRQYSDEEQQFLRNNPGDEARMASALGNSTSHRPHDSQTTDAGDQAENAAADRGQYSPRPAAPTSAYQGYLGRPTGQAQQQDATAGLLQQLIAQQQADKQRQDQERAAMREILMGRIKTASEPVSADSPGIKELIAARRLESQRGSERQRQVLAERRTAEGLGDSGAMDAGIERIEQGRSEADSGAVAEIMGGELQSKRTELQQLLAMAVNMGDAESARNLQAQLAAIETQLQQQQMSDVNSRFSQDLGFRKSSFMDDLGYRLMALQLGANANAAGAFL